MDSMTSTGSPPSSPTPEQQRWALEPEDRGDDYQGQTNPIGLLAVLGLFVFLYLSAGPRIFLVVMGIVVMIFLHELGHFATAKWTGMKVTQFFMFMGPRLWSFRRGETEYGIRLLPVGAFVRIVGMNNLDPCPPEDETRAYKNKSYRARMLVITAGSMMHFLQALVLFAIVTTGIGLNDPAKWSVGLISEVTDESTVLVQSGWEPGDEVLSVNGVDVADWDEAVAYIQERPGEPVMLAFERDGAVEEESVTFSRQPTPSVEAALEPGDDIVAIDGFDTTDWEATVEYIQARPGEEVSLTVERDGTTFTETVTFATIIDFDGDGTETRGFLGVGPTFERTRESPLTAVTMFGNTMWAALTAIPQFLSPATLSELGQLMFAGSGDVSIDSEEAERPVSLVGAVRIAGQEDFDITVPLSMLGIFNIFIGVLNLLPLLPLDGGHAAIATYERLRSRKGYRHQVDVAKLIPFAYAVIAVLGFIMISTVYLDIVRPIG
jgi:RIP metalloprotease RseP